MQTIIDKRSEIGHSYDEDTLIESLYELIDELDGVESAEIVIPAIFKFMEVLSDVDLGSPGPLVHFIEKFYPNYDDALIE